MPRPVLTPHPAPVAPVPEGDVVYHSACVRGFTSFLKGAAGRAALLVVYAELLQSGSRGDPELASKVRVLVDERLQGVYPAYSLASLSAGL